MARGKQDKFYTIDIKEEIERFREYHAKFTADGVNEYQLDEYVKNLIEQMIAHFDDENNAVANFIDHYTRLIVEGVSPRWHFHPLRYLRQMNNQGYHDYLYCLYGFAEEIYRLLVEHRMFDGAVLRAGFHKLVNDTLYLKIMPELPDALFH